VAHILVANEILANAVIAELGSGDKFADVAAKRSADDSKSKGGDLGWIHPGHLPQQFFAALKSLEPGQYTKVPIHTPYGWHVIRLIATRAANPPPFDQIKAQLSTNLQQDRYRRFLDDFAPATK
jgi:peptidyl-prolyl cis-trans isomerase C